MPTPLKTIMNTPLILRPLTDKEQDEWPLNPPTYALCLFDPNKDTPQEPPVVAVIHDDVLFDLNGDWFEK